MVITMAPAGDRRRTRSLVSTPNTSATIPGSPPPTRDPPPNGPPPVEVEGAPGGDEALLGGTAIWRALATFYAAVLRGMSSQAHYGASRAGLERVAAVALTAWPAAQA
jgi:hypothetical protein